MARRVLMVGGELHGQVCEIGDDDSFFNYLPIVMDVLAVGSEMPESSPVKGTLYTRMKWADGVKDPGLMFEVFATKDAERDNRLTGMVASALLHFLHETHPGSLAVTERELDRWSP